MSTSTSGQVALTELRRRMSLPQRHRLLHGYPLAAALHPADDVAETHNIAFDRSNRKLLIGILPHPFCNPAVTGCGYCTFPHEPGNAAKGTPVVKAVMQELERIVWGQLNELLLQPKCALYFGGGTANLTEPEPFAGLCKVLAEFELNEAEVTLEGVPAYFLRGKQGFFSALTKSSTNLLDIMKSTLPARHFRLSMGIQTFDEARLKQMGRSAFGVPDTFREVVEFGHKLGFTAAADLLFNLPGQTLEEMRSDVRRAVEIGLDHIGLYHLVLFRGLGTPWAEDDNLLAELPDNERACENWLVLREELLRLGFRQTTLTNFERNEFAGQPNRFRYEECSFRADEYEMLGIGPGAASYVATKDFAHGIKVLNPTSSEEYMAAVKKGKRIWNRKFVYRPDDQKALWLTRRLSALQIERKRYAELFGVDPVSDYPSEFSAMHELGLMEADNEIIRPSPKGMFYADSLAALFANKAIRINRELGPARFGSESHALPAGLLHNNLEQMAGHSPMG